MTDISQVIDVTVNVGDVRVSAEGFGTPLIFDEFADTIFPERVRSYTSLSAVGEDFESTSKVYKCATAIFAQERSPALVKVGRCDPADSTDSDAIDAIVAEDADWYCLVTTRKTKAAILALADKIATLKKIFLASSEDSDVIGTATDDVASELKADSHNRSGYMWHHQAGVDAVNVSYSIEDGIATITNPAHGLEEGDTITFGNSSGESNDGIDGDNTVASVSEDGNSFTVAATDAVDITGGTVDYFARYTFPEAAWAGGQLSSVPGSETWKFKQLVGIEVSPSSELSPAQETRALAKNANLYTVLGGVGHTHEGIMASGRFIDIQRGIDWLEARLGEAIANRLLSEAKVPYTDAGATILQADIASVLDQGVNNGLLGPLLDDSGLFYNIDVPKVADQLAADRAARSFPGITVQCQLAGAVHSLSITVNANV